MNCVCVCAHVPVVCDDDGCFGGDVGSVVTLMAGRREGKGVGTQPRRSFPPPLWWEPGCVDQGGWMRHRVQTRCTVFRHVQFCYNDE